jgi:hypothetical protein
MAGRVVYHVVPGSDAGWKVKASHASRASSTHENKADAVAHARDLVKNLPLGQVVIHKQDGTIETEHTYGRDPYPPRG